MSISYGTQQVVLQGIADTDSKCLVVQLLHIATDIILPDEPPLLPEVQAIIDHFRHLFAEPSSLPPRRACHHKIPLVPGA